MTVSLSAAVLAESDSGKGSPIGLFVVLLLIIAVYFLYRSMSGHIRRLPEKFPGYDRSGTATPAGAAPPAGRGTAGSSPNAPGKAADGEQPGPGEPQGGSGGPD
jgi:hypothetical protein